MEGDEIKDNDKIEVSESGDGVADITEEIIAEKPESNPDVIKDVQNDKPDNWWANFTDRYGRAFDPEHHQVNDKGEPVINKKDRFIRIMPGPGHTPASISKIGRKKKAKPIEIAEKPEQKIQEITPELIRERGYPVAQLTFNVGTMLGGGDFYPLKTDGYNEEEYLSQAWGAYLIEKDKELTPGVALMVALSTYVGRRFRMPNTSSKVEKIKTWLRDRFRRGKIKNATRNDTRSDTIGQDDLS